MIRDEFMTLLDRSGFNDRVRTHALDAWNVLEAVLAEQHCVPETLKAIDSGCLSSLGSRLENDDIEAFLIKLAAIRVILLGAGHTPASIRCLQARVRRRRIEGAPNGKYQFIKILVK